MNAFSWVWLKRPIFLFIAHYRNLRAKLLLAIWVRYAPILSPNNTHLHTALDIDISRYEYVYGPHTCMSGYVSAYHGVGKLHTILTLETLK